MTKILFPIDGSQATYDAIDRALGILKPGKDAPVTFLVVISKGLREMPEDAREYLEYDDDDELFIRDDEAKAALKRGEDIAKKHKVPTVKLVHKVGKPKETILAECRQHDLLVMHALRRSQREDNKHGNMVEEIARACAIDVLLIQAR